jgi:Bacterial antitoxin of type II TA system, VapB
MKQTININDILLEKASQCVGIADVNEIVDMALHELITNHQTVFKLRQPPVSIANKGKILGNLIEPSVNAEDFECLK